MAGSTRSARASASWEEKAQYEERHRDLLEEKYSSYGKTGGRGKAYGEGHVSLLRDEVLGNAAPGDREGFSVRAATATTALCGLVRAVWRPFALRAAWCREAAEPHHWPLLSRRWCLGAAVG